MGILRGTAIASATTCGTIQGVLKDYRVRELNGAGLDGLYGHEESSSHRYLYINRMHIAKSNIGAFYHVRFVKSFARIEILGSLELVVC